MKINGLKTNLKNDTELEKLCFEMACFFIRRDFPDYKIKKREEETEIGTKN